MTDGCGRINYAALRIIQLRRDMAQHPVAVQGRIAGSKGLWLVDPSDQSSEPKIWITNSQTKIKYTEEQLANPSNRVFDLLRVSQTKNGIALSHQPIINFAHNGVPAEVFQELLQEALDREVTAFIDMWDTRDLTKLWDTVFRKEGERGRCGSFQWIILTCMTPYLTRRIGCSQSSRRKITPSPNHSP